MAKKATKGQAFQSIMSETGYEIAVKRREHVEGGKAVVILALDGESFPMTAADLAWLVAAVRNVDVVRDSERVVTRRPSHDPNRTDGRRPHHDRD